MEKAFFINELTKNIKEFPEYSLGQHLYGVLNSIGVKISDLYSADDEDILKSVQEFREIEKNE